MKKKRIVYLQLYLWQHVTEQQSLTTKHLIQIPHHTAHYIGLAVPCISAVIKMTV